MIQRLYYIYYAITGSVNKRDSSDNNEGNKVKRQKSKVKIDEHTSVSKSVLIFLNFYF